MKASLVRLAAVILLAAAGAAHAASETIIMNSIDTNGPSDIARSGVSGH